MGYKVLVLGGARSGKSEFAQDLAGRMGERVLFVATAAPDDPEMAERIARHRALRPTDWRTVEARTGVARASAAELGDAQVVILDCVTLLASNLLMEKGDHLAREALYREIDDLLHTCREVHLVLVSNEVGMGLVPPYPSGRAFRDLLGWANRYVAERVDVVLFLLAGIPLVLKGGDVYEGIKGTGSGRHEAG
ncbi:MAG TPA: bifunctional adenosylcobinamide kinase/adenosylcobinamide-phosphate guanylyltransferase [Candidatus Latescibacteria bacterium]|nr:bifunctional adenosylcobinamide kinase/adenosylcobinamide-phosphate guanylyltransferase [Candidatus Latescibacterota bacterium]